MAIASTAPPISGLRKLRHDLLNPLNVLVGATGALSSTDLNETQRTWLRMIASTTERLQTIIDNLETYNDKPPLDGQEKLADLCSIAEARVGKPFDRPHLIHAIERVAGVSKPLRVLLVDDSPELATLVRTYISGTGWDLDVVETGERAVAQATTNRYDVVLMDIDLPGLDGATAAHAIRDPVVRIDDPEVAPLVPEFLDNRRAEVVMYREALGTGDYGRIQSAAHKMKGTGRGYGLAVISRIGGDLELAAHEKNVPAMQRLIAELDLYLRRVRIEA
jgi:CheY-like chemotaxis protein